ncbi:hypothetical protein E2562_026791 [Oryza meyeriana var. granulata]|uniref:Uncharacterized protein n=1 Tax=Oryza meyeriana var. granulata TaxID=110450 RepID=A0A6G1CUW3_9ORYZ|nr:hypothetical protein E2562_026791 [Oryza meyeriana var. granulata]
MSCRATTNALYLGSRQSYYRLELDHRLPQMCLQGSTHRCKVCKEILHSRVLAIPDLLLQFYHRSWHVGRTLARHSASVAAQRCLRLSASFFNSHDRPLLFTVKRIL